MNITISNLDRNTDGDIVTVVHYSITKTVGEHTASTYSTIAVEVGDDFVPYADLTEANVVQWVSDKLDLEAVEASLDAQLAEMQAPTKAAGVPWGNA
jgi:hypothetical protein